MKSIRWKNRNVAVFLIFLMLPIFASCQDSNFGNWLIYIGNKKLNTKWNIHNEIQYRNYNAIGDLEQLLLRTGVGYNLTENNNNLLLGYGYILSENYIGDSNEKASVNEHRIFQQYSTSQSFNFLKLNHRYRFEQRFVEDDFKLRLRYFLGLQIPFVKDKNKLIRYYFSAYNEIFLNTKTAIFDRNRLFAGLGFSLNKNARFEFGYMNQFFERTSRDQLNIIAFITF